ncbi:HGxxPAAW family protein [Streptomyces sp. NPDC051452]|uniref:HGxxPAAW family protein n=1 Tax=Streptomyces sp. NPDC051452 TaxID=3365654 RepID=UPI00379BC7E1
MSLYDEGHTIAGWTGVGIATAGGGLAGWGVCVCSPSLIVVGLALVAVSPLVAWALHLTGRGKAPGVRPREEWGMRVRDTRAREGHPGCVGCRLAGRGRRVATTPVTTSGSGGAGAGAGSRPLSPVE